MRELSYNEIDAVDGGIIPLLLVLGAAALVGGCATVPVKDTPPSDCVVGDDGSTSGNCPN